MEIKWYIWYGQHSEYWYDRMYVVYFNNLSKWFPASKIKIS